MVSLIDKLAIQEVITRYSYTYDVQDAEGFAALFTEDAAVTRCSQHQSNVGLSGQLWYPDRRVEGWRQRPYPRLLQQEVHVYSWDRLPSVSLQPAGPLSAEIMARGITDFRSAGRYVQALPYGRTADRADFRAVLREGKGTCSTKHALLAALAYEQDLPVVLTLGIYEMHERNTPGVGVVLARYGLTSLPEAHCYLTYAGLRIDVTRSGADPSEPIGQFLHEEAIIPAQIGAYKMTLHRQFIHAWLSNNMATLGGRSCEDVWRIREACIAALEQ